MERSSLNFWTKTVDQEGGLEMGSNSHPSPPSNDYWRPFSWHPHFSFSMEGPIPSSPSGPKWNVTTFPLGGLWSRDQCRLLLLVVSNSWINLLLSDLSLAEPGRVMWPVSCAASGDQQQLDITIIVPVVFKARYVMILRSATSLRGPKWHSLLSCHFRAQKNLDF